MNGVLVPWVIAATLLLFVAIYWIYTLETRVHSFREDYATLLKISEALDEAPDHAALQPLLVRLDDHEVRLRRAEGNIRTVEGILPNVIRGVGIVRYNAFDGLGGDQSFSVALVDALGHGAVMTGLHTGDEVRVYAKPLENWRSSYSLSADEQRALSQARASAAPAGSDPE